ncbi:MAG: ATP-binding protein [Sandaracinaceae bacterium]|nr:ATP-binding protein [Sandaracinaceae bacterium]
MLGISSVLLESKLTPQQTELVRTMHQSASSMRKILNDVLDLSRIESGRLELREESVDLRELVGEVLDVFAPAAADKGIELAAIVSADVFATVRLDAVRFGQVLTNLVSNAVKFTSEGEVVVTVERRGPRLRVTVRDTGVGIAREERERLFRPFEQTASGETSREIGSGLGLWISQRIVDSMGGVIGLEEVPRGTAFFVEWEAARGDPLPRDSTEIRVGVRILAVEDSEASARSLEAIAAGLAIEVTIARSIAEAIKLAPSLGELHAVLVDATLPGVTPVAAAEGAARAARPPTAAHGLRGPAERGADAGRRGGALRGHHAQAVPRLAAHGLARRAALGAPLHAHAGLGRPLAAPRRPRGGRRLHQPAGREAPPPSARGCTRTSQGAARRRSRSSRRGTSTSCCSTST